MSMAKYEIIEYGWQIIELHLLTDPYSQAWKF